MCWSKQAVVDANAAGLVEGHVPKNISVLAEHRELTASVAIVPVAVAIDHWRARRLQHHATQSHTHASTLVSSLFSLRTPSSD